MERRKVMDNTKKVAIRNAILVGSLCSISYLAVYIARNILGAVTPKMLESGAFRTEQIGTLSSVYFVIYAAGQLINGALGDKIKAKYMIGGGLVLAGICNALFSHLPPSSVALYIAYGATGLFLSMVYGPMCRVVAENIEPIYAQRCCLGFTFASFFGSPVAGVLAMLFSWQGAFSTSSILLALMGGACFFAFILFERKGIVTYGKFEKKRTEKKNGVVRTLIKHEIIKYTFISVITGVVRTSVIFWLPTYISERLRFSTEKSALIFTVSTFIISFSSFFAVFVYERMGRNINLCMRVMFGVAAVCFTLVYFVKQPTLNIILMIMAIMGSGVCASLLFSVYCQSLRETGFVSTAIGYIDCVSYVSAAIASSVFANAVGTIGWGGLVFIWVGLMAVGVIINLPKLSKSLVKE